MSAPEPGPRPASAGAPGDYASGSPTTRQGAVVIGYHRLPALESGSSIRPAIWRPGPFPTGAVHLAAGGTGRLAIPPPGFWLWDLRTGAGLGKPLFDTSDIRPSLRPSLPDAGTLDRNIVYPTRSCWVSCGRSATALNEVLAPEGELRRRQGDPRAPVSFQEGQIPRLHPSWTSLRPSTLASDRRPRGPGISGLAEDSPRPWR
jgi:hypothetical protein